MHDCAAGDARSFVANLARPRGCRDGVTSQDWRCAATLARTAPVARGGRAGRISTSRASESTRAVAQERDRAQ